MIRTLSMSMALIAFYVGCIGCIRAAPSPFEPGWMRTRECSTILGDTLRSKAGLGSASRLRVFRNGSALLRNQDFMIPPGDSLIVLASTPGTGDTVCLEKAYTPLLTQPVFSLYRREDVPVYREQSLDSAFLGRLDFTEGREDSSASRYRLNYSGSKSMAVSVGSGGGLGLDASLFLNLNGQVAEDVFLEGQLSDQSVPIQPEGNTATLKEVDTKYVKVFGKHYGYVLGDYMLDYGVEGEDRFTAKVEGVKGAYSRGPYGIRGSWSVSDGQYQSDTLRGVDGKQRGYYLRGRDGRQFITVLSGTERVWRNGAPLQRGVDYTIDYSEGRLDFLQTVQVTGENLFSAEFQYTDQNYQRTLASGELRDTAGALTWSVRAISETENKDKPLSLLLDSTSLKRFAALGDSTYHDSLGHIVAMPRQQSALATDLGLKLAGWDAQAALLFSQLDRNLYSSKDDEGNLGYSTRYLGRNTLGRPLDKGGLGQSDLVLNHESRSAHYNSFKQLIEPRGFSETWNLDARVAERGFLSDRVTLEERPFSRLLFSGELGRAEADVAADSLSPKAADGSLSRRAGVSTRLGGDKTFVEASSEAKLARSPDRRDNFRQAGKLHWESAGFMPTFTYVRNEWLSDLNQGVAHSVKQEPGLEVATLPFFGKVSFTTGLNVLAQSANYNGATAGLVDSVRDIGVSEKIEAFSLGPYNTDVFYAYHNHREWVLDPLGRYSDIPVVNDFNQVEWNNHLSDRKRGYSLMTSYRVSQTAELPLVERFDTLPGRGNYVRDTLLNTYHQVETGGDYVLVGLFRDTTVGTRPYQDLAFTATLDLLPAKFPFPVTGFLADIDFTLDLAMDSQDTTGRLGVLPLWLDGDIDKARSGRSRYSPAVHWKSPAGNKSLDINGDRSYTLATGIYASREKLWSQRGNYRQELAEDWDGGLEQSFEYRIRSAFAGGGGGATGSGTGTGSGGTGIGGGSGESENTNYAYGARVTRKLPHAFSLETRGQYLDVVGNSTLGPSRLQGVKPALKLEKTSLYNGRASLEYGVIYFWGTGDGGYYTTGEFGKGLTHRAEANANFQLGHNMFINADYIVRLEPGGDKVTQKLTAEARAVF